MASEKFKIKNSYIFRNLILKVEGIFFTGPNFSERRACKLGDSFPISVGDRF